jgi:hypothetical protein
MSEALAVTFIVIGLMAGSWAATMWKKRRGAAQKWVILLMVLAGIGIGTGAGALTNLNVISTSVGFIPLWVIVVVVVGFGFFLEVKGWNDHPTRTPILGAVVAVVLCAAIGQSVVGWTGNEVHQVQVTSVVHGKKG